MVVKVSVFCVKKGHSVQIQVFLHACDALSAICWTAWRRQHAHLPAMPSVVSASQGELHTPPGLNISHLISASICFCVKCMNVVVCTGIMNSGAWLGKWSCPVCLVTIMTQSIKSVCFWKLEALKEVRSRDKPYRLNGNVNKLVQTVLVTSDFPETLSRKSYNSSSLTESAVTAPRTNVKESKEKSK